MIYKIIIGLAGIFGIFELFKIKDRLSLAILLGQTIGILSLMLSPLNPNGVLSIIGSTLFTLSALVSIYYIFKIVSPSSKRGLITIPVSISLIFEFNHWPGGGEIALAMIIPITSYLVLVITRIKDIKNEVGFLTILTASALVDFSIFVRSWIN